MESHVSPPIYYTSPGTDGHSHPSLCLTIQSLRFKQRSHDFASEKGNLIYIIFTALSVYTFPSESVRRHDVVGLVSFLRSAPIFTNEKTSNAQ